MLLFNRRWYRDNIQSLIKHSLTIYISFDKRENNAEGVKQFLKFVQHRQNK